MEAVVIIISILAFLGATYIGWYENGRLVNGILMGVGMVIALNGFFIKSWNITDNVVVFMVLMFGLIISGIALGTWAIERD